MRPAPFYRPDRWTSPGKPGKQTSTVLFSSWNARVSASTVAVRCSDLRLFGSFSWQIRMPQTIAARVLADLRDGGSRFASLADAWDDEQIDAGISFESRKRRRGTLRSFAAWCIANGGAPKGSGLGPLARERSHDARTTIADRAEQAIATALDRRQDRDAVIVMLAWECGLTPGAIRDLRISDLVNVPTSDRCARTLRCVCTDRASGAWVFPSRNAREPLSLASVHATIDRAGLPTPVALLAARRDRIAALRVTISEPFDDARALAGES